MSSVLIILQSVIVIIMVLAIMLQKADGSSLAGLSGGGSGVVSNRTSNSFISKFTMAMAILFMINSLVLAKLSVNESKKAKALLESLQENHKAKDLEAPTAD